MLNSTWPYLGLVRSTYRWRWRMPVRGMLVCATKEQLRAVPDRLKFPRLHLHRHVAGALPEAG